MAKVKIYVQSIKEFETDIDNKYLNLELDQYATKLSNDTIYRKVFINDNAFDKVKADLQQTFCLGNNDRIIGIDDIETGSILYDDYY